MPETTSNRHFRNIFTSIMAQCCIGFFCVLILTLPTGCKKQATQDPAAENALTVTGQAAEYESQQAIWLIWPPADHTQEYANDSVTLELVRAISPYQDIVITAATDSLKRIAEDKLREAVADMSGITLFTLPSEEIWIRDMGPNFVRLKDGNTGIADFRFNAWGYGPENDPYIKNMEAFDRAVAVKRGYPVIKSKIISEGGNREINSQGVLMLTETVTLGRNPEFTKEAIEEELKRVLGAKKILWLKQGLLEDQHSFLGPVTLEEGKKAYTVVTTNGHIDEYARFVNDSTILLAEIPKEDLNDPLGRENKRRMDENLKILREATDIHGKPFHIVRMPMPKPILKTMHPGDPVYDYLSTLDYTDGSTFPSGAPVTTIAAASYLNFIITNKLIIAQKYGGKDPEDPNHLRDENARRILQEQFPDRKILFVNALSVNLGGGGLHCISMHEPTTKE